MKNRPLHVRPLSIDSLESIDLKTATSQALAKQIAVDNQNGQDKMKLAMEAGNRASFHWRYLFN